MNQDRGAGLLVLFIILSIVSQIFAFQAEEIGQLDYAAAVKTFDEYVKKRLKIDQIPGFSIGFLKEDFIWARGYGYSDLAVKYYKKALKLDPTLSGLKTKLKKLKKIPI